MDQESLIFSDNTIWEGIPLRFDIYQPKDFSELPFIAQAYGFVINKENEVLLVAHKNMNWSVPGGHIEGNETTVEGLVRELYEEAAVIVKVEDCIPFFVQKAYKQVNGEWVFDEYQARYIIKNFDLEEFKEDPDQDNPIVYQKFFPSNSLKQNLKWGNTTDFVINELKNF